MIARHTRPFHRCRPRGFSLTELMVVIGIIALLVGLLLVALGGVRNKAKVTVTQSTMQSFSQACTTFQLEHRNYPGYIPESVLDEGQELLTPTENALLNLMGGCYVLSPADAMAGGQAQAEFTAFADDGGDNLGFGTGGNQWQMSVNRNRIGEGPVIKLEPFAPYFTPSSRDFGIARGQVLANPGSGAPVEIPDLLDAWGQPIIYVRQLRGLGPLVGDAASGTPQYTLLGHEGYLKSDSLGDFGADQNTRSILGFSQGARYSNFAYLLRHPSIAGQARGAFALFSAGPDGIYFSSDDGPGEDTETGVADLDGHFGSNDAAIIEAIKTYDDVRVFGGG